MVAFVDGAVMAQLGLPDMKVAIAYALSFPERLELGVPAPVFPDIGTLTFEGPDTGRFPCLGLAFEACRKGGTLPAVINAANEIAVASFLSGGSKFTDIPKIVEAVMGKVAHVASPDLEALLAADASAREEAIRIVESLSG
jgi:1-deoxy-D-xylulose-5-phosphate reductoisomerase